MEKSSFFIDLQPNEMPLNRPKYSVLDKSKIKRVFDVEVGNWVASLKTVKI